VGIGRAYLPRRRLKYSTAEIISLTAATAIKNIASFKSMVDR
jgi:hypothetical protein